MCIRDRYPLIESCSPGPYLELFARGKSFQDSWAEHFVSDKFGAATTHWRKLRDRVDRGVGNPCPLLLIGLPSGIVTF